MKPPGNLEVFSHGQFGVGVGSLNQVSDRTPSQAPAVFDRLAEDTALAAIRLDHTQQHSNCGGLSGPIQAQKGIDFIFTNVQRKVIHCGHLRILLHQLTGCDCVIHSHSFL